MVARSRDDRTALRCRGALMISALENLLYPIGQRAEKLFDARGGLRTQLWLTETATGAREYFETACEIDRDEKMDERHRRMLEDNRKQIAEAEQRHREREEREAAEARKAQDADRAAYSPSTDGRREGELRARGARRRHRGCPPWIVGRQAPSSAWRSRPRDAGGMRRPLCQCGHTVAYVGGR